MRNNADVIRIRVFKIWFITLSIILLTFIEKISGVRNITPPFSSIFQSFQMVIGLVVPQIAIMSAFYFNLNKQKTKINSLSSEQVSLITFLSITYHAIFIVAIIFGIGFYGFDQQADGSSLERNTAAVVSIMGLFSTFLAPVAFLFSKPNGQHA